MLKTKEKIIDLNNQLLKWSEEYYINNSSSVSDEVYDGVYDQYTLLIKDFPDLEPDNSVLKKVGFSKIDNRFKKINHEFPMLSLQNAFNKEDVILFDEKIKKLVHSSEELKYTIEYKIDGLSISLIYNKGKFVKAVTRGDGTVGEDVTHNVLEINDIPKTISFKKKIEFRGEVFMSNKVFESLNMNGNKLANPRNAAAGSLRQLDSKIAKERKLSSFIYSIPNPLDFNITSQQELLDFVKKQKFNTNKLTTTVDSVNQAIDVIDVLSQKRLDLDYLVDGIVIKVDDISLYEDIGYTVKFPKFMTAYKFPAEIVETELLDIFPTIGRTGRVTYNAKLVPVRLAGSTVSAATLHNADYIINNNINVSDIVKVKKAGDIIPKVIGVAHKKNNDKWKEVSLCPSCNDVLIRLDEEVDQYCVNDNCPQVKIAKFEHFVSRNAMNIEGLSIEKLKIFFKEKLITDFSSIYDLINRKDDILKLKGFKEKSVNKLINSIEKSKKTELHKFIFALGIRHVGQKNSKILARRFGSIDKIKKMNQKELEDIRDLGPKVAQSVIVFFKDIINTQLVSSLISKGVKIPKLKKQLSSKLAGLTFAITGRLEKSRGYYAELIESHSGNISEVISAKTNYLLAGEKAGSKLEKAESLKVDVINEVQLKGMVNNE